MTRTLGDEKRGQNFEILATAPIDARLITPTKSSLTSLPGKYNGMICAVNNDTTNNGLYICSQNNGVTLETDWEKVGSNLTSIDADTITISNLENDNIKSNANIDQSKINGLATALSSLTTSVGNIPTLTSQLTNNSNFMASNVNTTTNNYASVGYVGHAGWAGFSHKDRANTTDFAILHNSGGKLLINTKSDQPIEFKHGNAAAFDMRINPSGSVGIGHQSSDSYKLSVNGDINCTGNFKLNGSNLTIPTLTSQLSNDSNFTSLASTSDIDINNIDCNIINTSGDVNLALGKRVMLGQNVGDTNSHTAGIYWHTGDDYAITRTPGAWSQHDYQQLLIKWGTGIILDINNSDHSKSFVDVKGKMGVNTPSKPLHQFAVDGLVGIGGFTASQFTLDNDVKFHVRDEDDNPIYAKIQACRENQDAGLYLGTTNGSGATGGGANKCLLLAEGANSWSRSNFHICMYSGEGNNAEHTSTLTDSKFKVQWNGNVSVGMGSVGALDKFHVRDGTLRVDSTGNTTNIPGLKIRERPADTGQTGCDFIQCGIFNDVGNDTGGGADGDKFIIKNDGKCGISNVSPAYTLDVTGDINCTGNFKVNGTNISTGGGIDSSTDVTCNSVTASKAKIGLSVHTSWAGFAHKSMDTTAGGYALLQHGTGITLLNANAGKDLHFRINNQDKMKLMSTGYFGINTTNPSERLEVVGNTKTTKLIVNSNDSDALLIQHPLLSASQMKIGVATIRKDGGSTSLEKLAIINSIDTDMDFRIGQTETTAMSILGTTGDLKLASGKKLIVGGAIGTTNTAGIYWHTTDSTDYAITRSNDAWSSPNFAQLNIQWGTGIIMRPGTAHGRSYVDVKGILGVNTTAKPLTQCEVNGTLGVGTFSTASLTNTDVKFIVRREGNNDCFGKIQTCRENRDAGLYLGTTLHGTNDAANKCLLIAEGKSTWSRSNFHICLYAGTGNAAANDATLSDSKFKVQYNGNVGIGFTSGQNADALLRVNGTIKCTTLTETSDNRLKHNESDISNCLITINKLKPLKYIKTNTIFDSSGTVYPSDHNFDISNGLPPDSNWSTGYVAQDVRLIPELSHLVIGEEYFTDLSGTDVCGNDVYGNITPQALGMDYIGLSAFHTGAIQELLKKVETLEAKVALLEGEGVATPP